MTIRTIKTNDAEANKILKGDIRFIFRSDKDRYTEGDGIEFRVIKNNKEVLHRINSRKYVVTAVMDWTQAPVERGYQFIGFKEV